MNTEKRLPGIYFKEEKPIAEGVLPRMDIACFVGFTSSGPLNKPVLIEDELRFAEIFGEDLTIGIDESSGAIHKAFLAPTVRAFFMNGGRRCWVIRVAERKLASNRYMIPGIIGMPSKSSNRYRPAIVQARSKGAWSNNLSISTVLVNTPIKMVTPPERVNNELVVDIVESEGVKIIPGDLLQFVFPEIQTVLFLAVAEINKNEESREAGSKFAIRVSGKDFWFRTEREQISPPINDISEVRILLPGSTERLSKKANLHSSIKHPEEYMIYLKDLQTDMPEVGSLLEVIFTDTSRMLLSVNKVGLDIKEEVPSEVLSFVQGMQVVSGRWPLWPIEVKTINVGMTDTTMATRLTFEMRVSDGKGGMSQLANLGFLKPHYRFWGNLPTDEMLFSPLEEENPIRDGPIRSESSLWLESKEPRFPVAASDYEDEICYLPIGMEIIRNHAVVAKSLVDADTALTGNNTININTDTFLDDDLKEVSTLALLSTAFHKRHVRLNPLEKVHGVLPVQEASLISVPDAVYVGWESSSLMPMKLLSAPELNEVKEERNQYIVSWKDRNDAEDSIKYRLQESSDPQFLTSVTDPGELSETKKIFPFRDKCPMTLYYRVRAEMIGKISPWSNTVTSRTTSKDFEACNAKKPKPPILREEYRASPPSDEFYLKWSSDRNDEDYLLQWSSTPDFQTPINIYRGKATSLELLLSEAQGYYYRVCSAKDGVLSAWSNTVIVEPSQGDVGRIKRKDDDNRPQLIEVHKALLRMSMARGDLFSILTLPDYYRESDILTHKKSLVSAFDSSDEKTLSYGALYHPWIYYKFEASEPRIIPPDGIVSGSMAANAIKKGVWVPAANDILQGVLALHPVIKHDGQELLYHSQVNIVSKAPDGFMLMSESTLSIDNSLRPINVRRLLILLRKIALKEGSDLVFEPNNEAFRRLVERKFEGILSDLYLRGAFAGETPDAAYRLITDGSINTPASLDTGRFIVELRVAPSQPMAFITVRLIQSGSEGPVFVEV